MESTKVKIVICGDPAVGKTSLLSRLCGQPLISRYSETVRPDIHDVHLSEHDLIARFWDVGGRYFDNYRQQMWEDAFCVIIVYDITNRTSFQSAVLRWYGETENYTQAAVTMLIGCKSDLNSDRVVAIKEAEEFATRHGIFFMEISAADKTNLELTLKILRIRVSHALRLNRDRRNQQALNTSTGSNKSDSFAQTLPAHIEVETTTETTPKVLASSPHSPDALVFSDGVSVVSGSIATSAGVSPAPVPSALRRNPFSEFLGSMKSSNPLSTPTSRVGPSRSGSAQIMIPSPMTVSTSNIGGTGPVASPVKGMGEGLSSSAAMNDAQIALREAQRVFEELQQRLVDSERQEQERLRLVEEQKQRECEDELRRQVIEQEEARQELERQSYQQRLAQDAYTLQLESEIVARDSFQPLAVSTPPSIRPTVVEAGTDVLHMREDSSPSRTLTERQAGLLASADSRSGFVSFEARDDDLYQGGIRNPSNYDLDDPSPLPNSISDRYEELKSLFSEVGLRVTPQSQKAAAQFVKNHPSSLSKLKTFEPRNGKLIPVVETAILGRDSPSTEHKRIVTSPSVSKRSLPLKSTVGEPALYVEIRLDDGRKGQIGVKEGDNAYHLAEVFARAMKLDRSYIKKLALLIQMEVRDYNKQHSMEALSAKKKAFKEAKEFQEAEMRRFAEPQPFKFATEKRSEERRAILFKLHIKVDGKGKMGLLAVRKGDDPFQLARNFVKTFKLRPQLISEIVEKIQMQIVNHYLERGSTMRDSPIKQLSDGTAITVVSSTSAADDDFVYEGGEEDEDREDIDDEEESDEGVSSQPEDAESSLTHLISPGMPLSTRWPGSAGGRVLFNLEIEIADGRKRRMQVLEGVSSLRLATDFATTHKLNPEMIVRLQRLIDQNLDKFLQQRGK